MKHYLLSITLIVMLSYSYGQKPNGAYLSNENKELLKKILKTEYEAEQRILAYLQSKPQAKRHVLKADGGIMSLVDIIDGKPLYMSTDNLDAAKATGVTELQIGGSLGLNLDGSGMTVAVWDGGPVQFDHVEFMDATNTETRITNVESTTTEGVTEDDDHATHVVGTISAKGVNAPAKGMATNVTIITHNFLNANSELLGVLNNNLSPPILLSNHSYGIVIQDQGNLIVDPSFVGAYGNGASADDAIHYNYPYHLKVTSAGNNGNLSYTGGLVDGIDKLSGSAVAKNNLVIANARPVLGIPFSNEITNLTINPSSSQGPTDDLRIKPDIAADGTLLLSTVTGDGYASFTGTSMSAPNTTGALVLLQQYYEQLNSVYMKSSTLRGLVCHTALDDLANPGPDSFFGWGFLNALEAVNTITNADSGVAVMEELTLDQGEEYTFSFSALAGDKIKASICWTDLASGTSVGVLNDQTPKLINDLDLRITKDGLVYEPWKLDFSNGTLVPIKGDNIRDNIEVVEIDDFETGDYMITVSHKGTLQGNVGGPFDPQSQDFTLILTGNNITLSTKNNTLSNSLVVYPNPNKGEFTISFNASLNNDSDIKVNVYDISGRLVYKNTFVNESIKFNKTINLNGVASGVYIANISKGSSFAIHKIIIE